MMLKFKNSPTNTMFGVLSTLRGCSELREDAEMETQLSESRQHISLHN